MPLWKEIFSDLKLQAVYVHVFRNPSEVAESLKKRDGFASAYSLLLWFLHNVEAVHHTTGEKRAFLEYEQLLKDWRTTIETVGQKLGIRWPTRMAQASSEINQFLSAGLYRNKIDLDSRVRQEGISDLVIDL